MRSSPIADLRAALAGRRSREVARRAVYRLLAENDEAMPIAPRQSTPRNYETALDDAMKALPSRVATRDERRQQERDFAARLAEIGRSSPPEARSRAMRLGTDQRRGVVTELVRLVDEAALDEPAYAIVLAGIAVTAADAAHPGLADLDAFDLCAEARRSLAEAAFRSGDLVVAAGALAEALRLSRFGTLDALLRADLLRLESEILSDQSQFTAARRLAERSVRLLQREADLRREARGRISLALKLAYEDRLVEALAENDRALAMVDAELDGRWVLAAEFNRASWRNDVGDSAAARAALPRLAQLVTRHGRALDRVRLAWLEARITAAEGDLARAAEIYRPVLARCLELETIYDSAMVALELAVVLLELDRADEVLPLADTVAPIFKAQGVEPEAAAAVLLAAESLRRGVAAREVLLNLLAARAGARRGR